MVCCVRIVLRGDCCVSCVVLCAYWLLLVRCCMVFDECRWLVVVEYVGPVWCL